MPADSRIPAPEGARRAACLVLTPYPGIRCEKRLFRHARVSTKAQKKPEHALFSRPAALKALCARGIAEKSPV